MKKIAITILLSVFSTLVVEIMAVDWISPHHKNEVPGTVDDLCYWFAPDHPDCHDLACQHREGK